jgi:hypothetical protein
MELSFVILIIVLGSGYIAFPVAKVFLAVFNKLIECLKKGNVVYIISFIKVKASIELSIAAHFFIII